MEVRGGEVKGWLSEAELREVGKVGGGDVELDMMSVRICTYGFGMRMGPPKEDEYVLMLNLR